MRRALIAAVVLVVALGACGSGTNGKASGSRISTAALVTGAADAAAEARTAKVSGEMSVAVGSRQMTLPIEGAIDFEQQDVEMRVDMSKMGTPGLEGSMEIRMVDGVMYMNMGSLLGSRAGSVLGGKDWVSIDLKDLGAGQSSTQNPADMLQSLRGAGDVREVGTDDIDGTATTKYHAEISLQKAIDKMPAKYRDLAEQGMKALGGSFPVDVWIDHDGLPRRFEISIDVSGTGSVKERIDFSDYGADVSIEAPPADQVQSMADFEHTANGV
jgi:hypothetical protein